MGVTVDLIPLLPVETPEHAIVRIHEGGTAVCWDEGTRVVTLEVIEEEGELVEVAPMGAFESWRAEVWRRLADLHPWQTAVEGSRTYLWSRNFSWQVEIDESADDITLRARRGWNPDPTLPLVDDAEFLGIFDGLRTIIHWPGEYGTWCDLDDPEDRPIVIG